MSFGLWLSPLLIPSEVNTVTFTIRHFSNGLAFSFTLLLSTFCLRLASRRGFSTTLLIWRILAVILLCWSPAVSGKMPFLSTVETLYVLATLRVTLRRTLASTSFSFLTFSFRGSLLITIFSFAIRLERIQLCTRSFRPNALLHLILQSNPLEILKRITITMKQAVASTPLGQTSKQHHNQVCFLQLESLRLHIRIQTAQQFRILMLLRFDLSHNLRDSWRFHRLIGQL